MCGIVGLFLKNPALLPHLGGHIKTMLIGMSERGPDSAGIAVYHKPVRKGQCKLTAFHADPNYPAVCKGFPYVDAETGGPYIYDQTICPEFEQRDDLHEVRRRGT